MDDRIRELHEFIKDKGLHQRLMVEQVQQECLSDPARIRDLIAALTSGANYFHQITAHLEKRGWSEPEFYRRAGISAAVFSNMRNPRNKPSKNTLLQCLIGLELDYTDSSALLEKAGYAFVWTDRKDLTIIYCIIHQIWDKLTIDTLLVGVGQNALFSTV